jgi:predicted nucleic acid-binding protein
VVVVDNNILSSLAKIDRLDWLPQVFDTVMTTRLCWMNCIGMPLPGTRSWTGLTR